MLLAAKTLPWVFPFLKELFKRGKRRPVNRYSNRDRGGSVMFLIAGFVLVIVVVVLFSGEKIITQAMENTNLKQENVTLRFARETNQTLVNELQSSNEVRGRQVDAILEQNRLLRYDIEKLMERNADLRELIALLRSKQFEHDGSVKKEVDKALSKDPTEETDNLSTNSNSKTHKK